jgi:hypothetical protein
MLDGRGRSRCENGVLGWSHHPDVAGCLDLKGHRLARELAVDIHWVSLRAIPDIPVL